MRHFREESLSHTQNIKNFYSGIPTPSVSMWQYTWSVNLSVLHVLVSDLPPASRLAGLSLGPICVTIVIEQSPSLCVNVVFPVGCVCLCVCVRVCVCVWKSFCNIPIGNSTQVSWCVHYKSSLISLKLPLAIPPTVWRIFALVCTRVEVPWLLVALSRLSGLCAEMHRAAANWPELEQCDM